MSVQFTFPGFEAGPSDSLPATKVSATPTLGRLPFSVFFSLFPPSNAAKSLATQAAELGRRQGLVGKPLLPHRLHVTLHDLGNFAEVPPSTVTRALAAGAAVAASAFDVAFDCAMSFPSSGTYVFCGDVGTAQLVAFRQNLGSAMQGAGLKPKTSFTPHMTVAYDSQRIAKHAIAPVVWTATEFVLIKSHVGKGVHELLGRWPLRA